MNFVVQWHITEECNWRCTHCYHDQYLGKGPSLDRLKGIFDEMILINKNHYGDISYKQINFAGGEPLVRKDFLDLLKYISGNVEKLRIGILTNGSLITEKFLDELEKLENIDFVFQISLEGTKKINDSIRGIGSFDIITKKVDLLKKRGFKHHLSFTLTKNNKEEVFKLIPFVKENSIRIGLRRFVPMGQGSGDNDLMLTPEEWYKFGIKVSKVNLNILKGKGELGLNGCSEVTGYKYNGGGCAVSKHQVLIVMDNLDVLSCRKVPVVLGNLETEGLNNIFMGKEYLKQIDSYKQIEVCKKCPYLSKCRGGAKCITYAVEGSFEMPDPQCFFAKLLKNKKSNLLLKK